MTGADGRPLAVEVHPADVQGRDGAKGVPKRSRARFPFLGTVCADRGCAGRRVEWAQDKTHVALGKLKRPPGAGGFVVIRRRRVVERTSASTTQCRRLARDHAQLTAVADARIAIPAVATLVRRWARLISATL